MRRKTILVTAGLAALIAAWAAAAPLIADSLVKDRPIERADAIIILSGAADYLQRAKCGADAYHRGTAPTVLITDDGQRGGWDDSEKGNPFFVQRMRRELELRGVPAAAIEVLPGTVSGTADEAVLAVDTAVQRRYERVLVITSAYHSSRALWTFERVRSARKADLVCGLAVSPNGEGYPGRSTWWLTGRGWRTVGAEYVKFIWYWSFFE